MQFNFMKTPSRFLTIAGRPVLAAIVISLAGHASALNANANGISDIWEAGHPAAAAAPDADPDGDGSLNRKVCGATRADSLATATRPMSMRTR